MDTQTSLNDGEAASGYAHAAYAGSLAEWGTPRLLPRCGGWILERAIPGASPRDAMGCYPLFACRDWSQLHADLAELEGELVSLALVTDPFGALDLAELRRAFGDQCVAFKEHYVADLSRPLDEVASKHHRRDSRRALQSVSVEAHADAAPFVGEWNLLYDKLIERHGIRGLNAFSRESFARQLAVPGMTLFRAVHDAETVGMALWYMQGEVAYYHLSASNERGYQLMATYALMWRTFEYFAGAGLRWLDIGAGAGLSADGSGGLNSFKRGWATGTRTAYFCGRILDRDAYARLVREKNVPPTDYFPAYRQGEFG